jgi:catechol 2,3-dioxygenase-like lactoylglutathione lyase family enzyme
MCIYSTAEKKEGTGKMRLRQLLILSRDVSKSTRFYQKGLGLRLLRSSDTFAEFDTLSGVPLCIKQAQRLESFFFFL